jgi:hypothetical protein
MASGELSGRGETSLVRTAEAQVRGGYVLCHRSMIHGALLGTPDEGMKEERGKVESGDGREIVEWICAVEFGTDGVLELCEVVPLRRHRRLLRLLFGGQALVAGSLPRSTLLSFTFKTYQCHYCGEELRLWNALKRCLQHVV